MSESTTVKLLIILHEHLILITHEAVIGGYYMLSVFIKHGGFQVSRHPQLRCFRSDFRAIFGSFRAVFASDSGRFWQNFSRRFSWFDSECSLNASSVPLLSGSLLSTSPLMNLASFVSDYIYFYFFRPK